MEYVRFGATGLRVSRLFFGGFAIGGPAVNGPKAHDLVQAAWDVGINTFYTSDVYNGGAAEEILGEVLASRRDDVVLMVKTGGRISTPGAPDTPDERWARQGVRGSVDFAGLWSRGVAPTAFGLSRKYLMQAVERSLRRLKTDYIDVYVSHFWDPLTPIEETLATMDLLVQQGKVRYIGCSQTRAWQLYRALWVSDRNALVRYESVQAWLSLLQREHLSDLLPAAHAAEVSFLAFASLAGTALGEYDRDSVKPRGSVDTALVARLGSLANSLGRDLAEMAQAWVLAQPGVTALLIGPSEAEWFAPQARAVANPLTVDELHEIDAVLGS